MAAKIQEELGLSSELVPGSPGQLDVEVDGQVVASRKKGLLASLLGGWPDPDHVVHEIERRMPAK